MLQDFWRGFKAIFSPDAGYEEAAERPCLRCAERDAHNASLEESFANLRRSAQGLAERATAAQTKAPKRKTSKKAPAKKTSAKKATPRRRSR